MASEKEVFFYADITKPEGLSQAHRTIIQDQYSYDIKDADGNSSGIIRVRSESENGQTVFEQTIKYETKQNETGIASKEEQNISIEKSFYDAWIKCFGAAGCHKVRYVFKSSQIKLRYSLTMSSDESEEDFSETVLDFDLDIEVDVFIGKNGERAKTCKVDIELDGLFKHLKENHPEIKAFDLSVILSNLPLGLENIFNGRTDDPEHRAKSKALWDEYTYKDSERVS